MKNVILALLERGFIDQMTSDELQKHVMQPICVYVGFDPTADSLHLGNLVGIVALAWFQKYGHTAIPLLGGATGLIGDPSGKSLERPLLDEKTLAFNVGKLEAFFQKVLPHSKVVNNYQWIGKLSLIEFLRDVGKHFRIGPMLAKESVKSRVQSEEGMSFTEFSYQTLQGYDFYYLNKHQNVTLQMGEAISGAISPLGSSSIGSLAALPFMASRFLYLRGVMGKSLERQKTERFGSLMNVCLLMRFINIFFAFPMQM